jgi:hypothetical protein
MKVMGVGVGVCNLVSSAVSASLLQSDRNRSTFQR